MCEDSTRSLRVALLGGSFDPPHVCHLLVSSYVLAVTDVDQVWWLPCASHAFGKQSAPFEDRVAMCELATRSRDDVLVSDVEARLDRPSYTIDTVAALRAEYPQREFVWIAGSDLLGELRRWHRWQELLRVLDFVVVRRGDDLDEPPGSGHFDVLPLRFPDISSTQVRESLLAGGDVAGLVDSAVLDTIRRRGLYRS